DALALGAGARGLRRHGPGSRGGLRGHGGQHRTEDHDEDGHRRLRRPGGGADADAPAACGHERSVPAVATRRRWSTARAAPAATRTTPQRTSGPVAAPVLARRPGAPPPPAVSPPHGRPAPGSVGSGSVGSLGTAGATGAAGAGAPNEGAPSARTPCAVARRH